MRFYTCRFSNVSTHAGIRHRAGLDGGANPPTDFRGTGASGQRETLRANPGEWETQLAALRASVSSDSDASSEIGPTPTRGSAVPANDARIQPDRAKKSSDRPARGRQGHRSTLRIEGRTKKRFLFEALPTGGG